MGKNPIKSTKDLRKKHNVELIRRMREGDPLKSFDSQASWYPPRPIIAKDEKALAELYGFKAKKKIKNIPTIAKVKPQPGMATVTSLQEIRSQADDIELQDSSPEAS